jgi:histidyl-tRNA synthetase
MSIKPSLPKGTRDFLPEVMLKREYITNTIKSIFGRFGFAPIETPAMENLETLTGKYGEEGDRLIFKILNSGDFLAKADQTGLARKDSNAVMSSISEKALRYDLTVPFARFVVQNQNALQFPFKRYQIQPVWRADRPQKGRFREFYQCDADVVGSNSLFQELEFISIYQQVFAALKVPVSIRLNNRKLLAGMAESFGIAERLTEFTVALDKLDKIGVEGVQRELESKDFSPKSLDGLAAILKINDKKGELDVQLNELEALLGSSSIALEGIEEIRFLTTHALTSGTAEVQLDVTLARGLDYYTGSIFEVVARGVEMGSIGGGGRYADLTGIFGKKDLPGVGISFGLDRIYLVMEELELFPDTEAQGTQVLFAHFGEQEALFCFELANEMRQLGINVELYPEAAKMKKQMDFANKRNIPYVILIGSSEMASGEFILKNMHEGTQQTLSRIELLNYFSQTTVHTAYGTH